MFKTVGNEAAAREKSRRTLCGTLRLWAMRGRSWRPFSTSCYRWAA